MKTLNGNSFYLNSLVKLINYHNIKSLYEEDILSFVLASMLDLTVL